MSWYKKYVLLEWDYNIQIVFCIRNSMFSVCPTANGEKETANELSLNTNNEKIEHNKHYTVSIRCLLEFYNWCQGSFGIFILSLIVL